MASFLLYLIQSSICLGLFYLFFVLVMRRLTLFRFNRLTLLAGSVVCLVLPFIPITVNEPQLVQLPMQALSEMLVVGEQTDNALMTLPANEVEALTLHVHDAERRTAQLLGIYLTGALVTFAFIGLSFVRMWQLIRRAPYREENGYRLIVLPQPVHPFSFGRYIVLSEADYRESPYVLMHERMHLHHRHTLDSLWFMAVVIVYWFNPLVWLMRMEMQQLHEYEADESVIKQGINATQYQLLLVKKAVGTRLYSMANGFNHSKLKNRITMMLEKRTNGWARLRVLLAVPVAMGTLLAFARPEVKETSETSVPRVEQQDRLKTFEELKKDGKNRRIKTIELTFIDHENEETVKKTLRNFTLVELKKALKEYTGNKEYLVVSMKMDKNTPTRDVNDVKETLREAYALSINVTNK